MAGAPWRSAAFAVALLLGLLVPRADAATTDLSNEPIITKSNVAAKPNLMFILDDSGSMGREYMPDELADLDDTTDRYGYWSAQCNGVAYDPTLTYQPPLNSDGTSFAPQTFTSARSNGYDNSSSAVDLTSRYYYTYGSPGTQPRLSWKYNSDGSVNNSSAFYTECMSRIGSSPGQGKFTRVDMSAATTGQKQNYANWYSYYRARYLLMRTAVGRAVQALDSGYRVGFSRINRTTITDGPDFRDAKPFDSAQKALFYSSLYGAAASGGTPLRGALAKIGRYYAKKESGQTYDPVEYACTRNYALLTTDGYWNIGGSTTPETSSYGPIDLAGSNVGNRDATEVRPMYDGSDSTVTTRTPTTTVTLNKIETTTPTTKNSSRTLVVYSSTDSRGRTCAAGRGARTTTAQTRTERYSTLVTSYSQVTQTSTRTEVVTNGFQTSSSTATTTTTTTPASPVPPAPVVTPGTDSGWVNGRVRNDSCSTSYFPLQTFYQSESESTSNGQSTAGSTTQSVTGPTVGAPTVTTTISGGTTDTLADVSQYYYRTDLRTAILGNCSSTDASGAATDVCSNIVPVGGRDQNSAQHMTTFSIGLGLSGVLTYDKNYLNQTTGDYVALTNGTKNWPFPQTTGLSGNTGDARNIDDLWHAAVNGRGQYYSALDAASLGDAISGVANAIKEANGSAAAAAFNTLGFVSGDSNRLYQAGYTTSTWAGELRAIAVDGVTGDFDESQPVWRAQARLDAKSAASRKIYYRQAPGTSTLREFTTANLDADGYIGNFTNLCSKTLVASQCAGLSASNLTLANTGSNLVDYLRGDRSYEGSNSTSPLYRSRAHVLGDIVGGAPVFVGKPPFVYTDAGYASFAAAQASRTSVVYAAANDGMLHAFSAATGEELWAYVPTTVMPNMYKLANASYGNSHIYLTDGEPVVGDILVAGSWKTILVAGLNAGGNAYYALDITDPNSPKTLWEFTDSNLGLSFGNPVITKKSDGTWVVAFASGYNNTGGTEPGVGRLYVVNANTGALLHNISTGAGSAGSPSGLAKINAWVKTAANNNAERFYGGDMLGNLWRFDIDSRVQPYLSAQLIAQFQTASGAPQPVTTKPEMVEVAATYPVVAVGTGRYLGLSDIPDTTQQSLYVVKDPMAASGVGIVRNNPAVIRNTLSVAGTTSTISNNPVDWASKSGWWFDFPNSGERMVTSMALLSGTLTLATAVPSGDACTTGGSSWLYQVNITTGQPNPNQAVGTLFSETALLIGFTAARLATGPPVDTLYLKDSTGKMSKVLGSASPPAGAGDPRRSSWRELVD